MPRQNNASPTLPKLFKHGNRPSYYFRRSINGKPQLICTHTDDLAKATEYLTKYMNAEVAVTVESKVNQNTRELATKFSEAIIGNATERITLDEMWTIWREHSPDFEDIAVRTKKHYESIFTRLVSWCKANEIHYVEVISKG